jgi:Predicted Zn-dependent protease
MNMPFYMGMDPLYIVIALVSAGLSMAAQTWVKSAFAKYSRMRNTQNLSGAEAAQLMLHAEGVDDVEIRRYNGGMLSDHFDPRQKVINLSPEVYDGRSVASVGVACHEAGHALQHAAHYTPLVLRSLLVGPTNIGSKLAIPLIIIGMVIGYLNLAKFGVVLFGVTLLFQLVTLPVEINASSRSKHALISHGIVNGEEARGVSAVLNAAAFTYVAAAVSSLMFLLYWAIRLGLLGGRSRD